LDLGFGFFEDPLKCKECIFKTCHTFRFFRWNYY